MNYFLKGKRSLYFKFFAVFILLFSSFLPSFTYGVAYAEANYEDSVNGDENGSTRNEREGREYDRANIDKRVTWSGENPGEYFIDLTVEGKTAPSEETTDIVLVYDNSNSMATNNRVGIAREATIDFVNGLLGEMDNFQMGLITYGTAVFDGRSNPAYQGNMEDMSYKGLTSNPANITDLLPSNVPNNRGVGNNGGTFTQDALREAGNVLASSTNDNKIIVTITDGVPTLSYSSQGNVQGNGTNFYLSGRNGPNHGSPTINEANQLKESYELYTIAVEMSGDANATEAQAREVVEGISSSSDHTYFASAVEEIVDHLNDISRNLTQSVVDGSVVDPMGEMFNLKGADNFVAASDANLSDGNYFLNASNPALLEGVTVLTDGQTININGLNLGAGDEVTLRYKVQIDTDNENFEVDKLYRTNGETTLTPRSSHPEEKNTFPEPGASATGITASGEKTWQDNNLVNLRPDDIEIKLMRDIGGTPVEVDSATVTPNEDGTWTYEFPNQIKFDSQGNNIDYYVVEEEVPGYETEYGDNRLDITNILISNPEISLEKNASRDDLIAGEKIEYTFTVVNTGNQELHDVQIEDTLENISDIEYLTINGEPITNSDSITLQPGDVLVATATYTITQADVDSGQVENFATVTGTSPTDEEVTDDDEAKVPQELNPEISLVKTSNLEEISEVGQEIIYSFEVENTGNVTLNDIELTDPMLGGAIELETNTLAPGESTTGTATYEVTQEDLNNGGIENTAVVTAEDPKETPVEDEDNDTLRGNQAPDISLVKVADRDDLVAGEDINYRFTATNTGNVTLTDVTIEDVLEGISDTRYVTINGESIDDPESITLEPDDVLVAEASYTITQEDVDTGQVVNHATVTGYDPNEEPVTDDDREFVPHEPNADISLEKTSNVEEVTEAGQVIEYTFTVTNTGDVTLTDIVVEDPMIDADIDLETTTLAPGETTTGTAEYTVTEADLENGNVTNVATVTGNPPNPEDEPPTEEDENIVPVGSINLVKTSDVDAITEVGQEVTYTFEVTNTGEVTLDNVVVTDPMIEAEIELETTTLEPGESTTGTAVYVVTQEDIDNEGITNTATSTGNTPEDTPVEDEDTDNLGKASINLVKTSNVEEITEVGQGVTYTFEVTNTGDVTLENVQVNDPMLGGEITLNETTLAPGESTIGTAVYIVTQADLNNGGVTNTATTTGETPEGTTVDDEDDDELPATQNPDISLVKEADPEELVAGDEITYTFTVTNTGNVTLHNVQITDPLEGLSDIRYLTINGESIEEIGMSPAWAVSKALIPSLAMENQSLISLNPGDELVAEATYTVTQEDVDRGVLENTATVEGTSSNDETVTDEDDVVIEQDANPAISLEKTSDVEEVTEAGQVIEYTFTVTNTGNVTLTDIELDDPMLGGNIELDTITLAPGETTTGTAEYTVTQEDLNSEEIVNVATVEGTPPGYDPEDPDSSERPRDEDENRVPTEQEPAISLVKEADRNDLVTDEEIIYTFTATNTGNVTLTDVTIEDVLEGISEVRYLTVNGEELEDADSITLEPGDVLVAEATYTITQEDVDTGQVANQATVTGTTPNEDSVTDDDEALVPQDPNPSLKLEKTSDKEEISEAGEAITYTFVVTNTGNITLTDVQVDDPMLAELGIDIELEETTLAPGESTTGSAVYTVTQEDIDNGSVTNVATSTGTPLGYDPEDPEKPEKPTSPPDEVEVPVKENLGISLVKEADRDDLVVGEEILYTFTATNTGNVTLTDVNVVDVLEGISEIRYLTINGEELGEVESITLAPGDVLVAAASYTIIQADVDNGVVENHATVTGTSPNGKKVTDEDKAVVLQETDSSITLVKTSDVEEITEVGQKVTYTFKVKNTGNVTLTNVSVDDPMLGGAIELEETTLAPGEQTTGTAVYEVTQADLEKDGILNVATATGHTPEDDPVKDEDEDWTPSNHEKPEEEPKEEPKEEQPKEEPKEDEPTGDKLVQTANNILGYSLLGLLLLAVGIFALVYSRKRRLGS